MPNDDVYIMYSGATNVTGQKLQESLDINGGRELPETKKKIIIGWGAKTNDLLTTKIGGADCVVFNHPNAILENRNKYDTIRNLMESGVNIKNASAASDVFTHLDNGSLSLPLIGRRNYHQGGKGFWLALTRNQVKTAIDDENGAQYFQDMIPITDEYRLHIIDGTLVYVQKKVRRIGDKANAEAFIEQQKEKIEAIAAKNNEDLDTGTIEYVLGRLSKEHVKPSEHIRSNTRGWKFSRVKLKDVKENVLEEATKALEASGLTFGAVDCAVDDEGKAWIIEINSGPGLEKSSLKAYVSKFKSMIENELTPPENKAKDKKAVNKTKTTTSINGGSKSILQAKIAVLSDLVSVASEEESVVLANLWDKLS